ncbi:heavy-metal-associated domain-containing protein (plasmid) [Burkholderia pyrrocinia]|uniref:heavy-metal-associated domain-containing protein n=1 Tax=Burkholderia pyrrocinia TaxID=60550 RepID=UPI0038B4DB6D
MQFSVKDMSCDHCARAITAAVAEVDPRASVEVDVDAKCVTVISDLQSGEIAKAIAKAGYTPLLRPS